MKKIKYTPDAADKIRALNQYITHHYGSDKAQKIIRIITDAVRGLSQNERKGVKASNMFDIVTDYRYIFIAKNYIFYRIEEEYICIINIYNEREDFMWQLFGIKTIEQDNIDYWED